MRRSTIFLALWMGHLAGCFLIAGEWATAEGERVGVYTYHGDNRRLGWNERETALSHANVNTAHFGRLWSRPVEGQVYAQPLYVPDVDLGEAGVHNLVCVATEHNRLYAFDADAGGKDPLWETDLGPSVPNSIDGVPCSDIEGPEYGITGTPVIDPATRTIYVVSKTFENGLQFYRLHARDIATGRTRPGWPVMIRGSVAGNGGGSEGGRITFQPRIQLQRAGLMLLNGRVIIAFASHCDLGIEYFHGWLFSYSAADPTQPPVVFNTTPDLSDGPFQESAGGIWQAGCAPAADEVGNIYFETANGLFNADQGGRNVGDSFVRLSSAGGTLTFTPDPANFYTPSNERNLDANDRDLGTGGAVVLPDQKDTTTPHLIVGGAKDGVFRLLNRDYLGGFTGRRDSTAVDNALQSMPGAAAWPAGIVYSAPAYWEGPDANYLFCTRYRSPLYRLRLGTNPNGSGASWLIVDGQTKESFGSTWSPFNPSGPPVVTSNGRSSGSGIVWVLRRDDDTLRAYKAEDLGLLWHSGQAAADALGGRVVKFTTPIVANGKVYCGMKTDGAHGQIVCYGLR
jgi:hypothetical protein